MNLNNSKMKKEQRYLYAPTMLLNGLIENPEAVLTDILIYGIYYNSKRMKFDTYDTDEYLISQFVYDCARNGYSIPTYLINRLDELDFADYLMDGPEGMFNSKGIFEPDEIIREIKELSKDNESILDDILEYSRVRASIDFFDLKEYLNYIGITIEDIIIRGGEIELHTPSKETFIRANKDKLIEFRDNDKEERDLVMLAVSLSVRSIIGQNRGHCKTTQDEIFARAFGYSTAKKLPLNPTGSYKNYTSKNRKKRTNILNNLQKDWNIRYYTNSTGLRGTYVIDLYKTTYDDFMTKLMKQKYKLEIIEKEKKEIEKRVEQEILSKYNIKKK